jgi:hypothetical protein
VELSWSFDRWNEVFGIKRHLVVRGLFLMRIETIDDAETW